MNTNAFKAIEKQLKHLKFYDRINLSHLDIHSSINNAQVKLTSCQYMGCLGSPKELRFAVKRTDMQAAPTSWYHYLVVPELFSQDAIEQIKVAIKVAISAKTQH